MKYNFGTPSSEEQRALLAINHHKNLSSFGALRNLKFRNYTVSLVAMKYKVDREIKL